MQTPCKVSCPNRTPEFGARPVAFPCGTVNLVRTGRHTHGHTSGWTAGRGPPAGPGRGLCRGGQRTRRRLGAESVGRAVLGSGYSRGGPLLAGTLLLGTGKKHRGTGLLPARGYPLFKFWSWGTLGKDTFLSFHTGLRSRGTLGRRPKRICIKPRA